MEEEPIQQIQSQQIGMNKKPIENYDKANIPITVGNTTQILRGYTGNGEVFLTNQRIQQLKAMKGFEEFTKTPTISHLLDLYFEFLKHQMETNTKMMMDWN